ncbi:MAG: NAD-dependent epimerase/dehydratase family protein [Solirubrobacteraceae bacterium]
MRVLITGGAGFIGSSTAIALAARHPDWELVACDNLYRRGSELNLPRLRAAGVEFAHADVRHLDDLLRVGPVDALVECSAEPSVMASGDVIVPVNLMGAYHCFELAARHRAQVIFLSTSRVYPVATIERLAYEETATRYELAAEQPVAGASARGLSERFPLEGSRTMYGASKLAGELLLAEYDVPWVVNRCGVVAGPWQMGKVDQGVFTHWMLSHHFGRELSYIGYGGSGKQVRDLLHVDDLVDLVEEQLGAREHWTGRAYNVGGGRDGSLSLLETTAICRELTGHDVRITPVSETRAGDVRCYLSDCSALYAHTDWRPRRGPQQVLADIHAWLSEHEDLVRTALV